MVERHFEIVIISVQQKYAVKYALKLYRSKRDQGMNTDLEGVHGLFEDTVIQST
jgi:hypothetical protein